MRKGLTKKNNLVFFGGEWIAASTDLIGSGSFGQVYLARKRDEEARLSAIKVISVPQNASDIQRQRMESASDEEITNYYKEIVKKWESETKLMEHLRDCKNIVQIEDHNIIPKRGQIGWDIHIRMELLTGLIPYCLEYPDLSERCVLKLGMDICAALERCRQDNVIHRDIKPENIFISQDRVFKLGDFGIAKELDRTLSGQTKAGTFTFMSPEVYRGGAYGPSVDIYSLGLVLYTCLNNNRQPFLPPLEQSVLPSHRDESLARRMSGEPLPPPANASERTAKAILKACAFDPAKRFRSPAEFYDALKEIFYSRIAEGNSGGTIVINSSDSDHTVKIPTDENEGGYKNPCPQPSLPKPLPPPVPSEPPHRFWRIAALTASLLAMSAAAIICWYYFSIPELTNLSYEAAIGKLNSRNMDYERIDSFNDTIEAGLVAKYERVDSTVKLYISKGPEFRPVPDLFGRTKDEAEELLAQNGFTAYVEYVVDRDKDYGKVFEQSTAPDGRARYGDVITLRVYAAEEPVEIPGLQNMPAAQAIAELESLRLQHDIIDEIYSSEFPEGYVITQIPASSEMALPGDLVRIIVSKGPEPEPNDLQEGPAPSPEIASAGTETPPVSATASQDTSVQAPSVVGLSREDAASRIVGAGLQVSFTERYDDSVPTSIVIDQSPASGVSVAKGSTVSVTVSKGSDKIDVPYMVNLSRSEAQSKLSQAGLAAEFVEEYNDNISAGYVFNQSPASGTSVSANSTVTVYLSKGSNTKSIPSVVGANESSARATLESAGFQVSVNREHSESGSRGNVLRQSPEGTAAAGSTVTITVSRGTAGSGWLDGDGSGVDASQYNVTTRDVYKYATVETKTFSAEQGGEWKLVEKKEVGWGNEINNGSTYIAETPGQRSVRVVTQPATSHTEYQYYHYCGGGKAGNNKSTARPNLNSISVKSTLPYGGDNSGGVPYYTGSKCPTCGLTFWHKGDNQYSPYGYFSYTVQDSAESTTYYYKEMQYEYVCQRTVSTSDWLPPENAPANSVIAQGPKKQYSYSGK